MAFLHAKPDSYLSISFAVMVFLCALLRSRNAAKVSSAMPTSAKSALTPPLLFEMIDGDELTACTGELTLTELLIKPYRDGAHDIIAIPI